MPEYQIIVRLLGSYGLSALIQLMIKVMIGSMFAKIESIVFIKDQMLVSKFRGTCVYKLPGADYIIVTKYM